MAGTFVSGMTGGGSLQSNSFQGTAALSLVLNFGSWSIIVEDRLYSPLFQQGWTYVPTRQSGSMIASANNPTLLVQNQINVGGRWGPLTLWFMEDFTPGYVPQAGGDWFYDANAPDIAAGLTFAMDF